MGEPKSAGHGDHRDHHLRTPGARLPRHPDGGLRVLCCEPAQRYQLGRAGHSNEAVPEQPATLRIFNICSALTLLACLYPILAN